jgi:hypothetical protein
MKRWRNRIEKRANIEKMGKMEGAKQPGVRGSGAVQGVWIDRGWALWGALADALEMPKSPSLTFSRPHPPCAATMSFDTASNVGFYYVFAILSCEV